MSLWRRSVAEFWGTFWLVLGGCGAAVIASGFPQTGIGFAGVALAFGLTVLTMAYALGPICGAHFNPAVSIGLWIGGRFPAREVPAYAAAQVAGALFAGLVLYGIATGSPTFDLSKGFAANGYGAHSPGHYSMASAAFCELVLTCGFVFVIMGATDITRVPAAFAPISIGLALTLIHLVSIPVTNTSVNPARSTGVALFAGRWALGQLWLFWLAPIAGGVLGGAGYRALTASRSLRLDEAERPGPQPGGIVPGRGRSNQPVRP
jgi:aquaporin Z